ncbi:hypothetical protein H072_126 [Dactylellina haptotyla CBS 200.50]|uniref:Uncharacterized protein n=1 Tax=Dactylellina haptotyla (strain CBS 200.50) TaxID=1284197 RepID=S8ASA7_DACHA|nr:hypothetical protein H072_126 [Dactylellina haptotyla CBS 200.50]
MESFLKGKFKGNKNKAQENSARGAAPSRHERELVATERQGKQEHWSPDTLDIGRGVSESTVVGTSSTFQRKPTRSESSASALEQTSESSSIELFPPQYSSQPQSPVAKMNLPTVLPPRADTKVSDNKLYTITTSDNPTPFDFDEDDLSDVENDGSRKIGFHVSEIQKSLEKGNFDQDLFTHISAVVFTYGVYSDTKLVILLAIMLTGMGSKSRNLACNLLDDYFRYNEKLAPEMNLTGYLLRAQLYQQGGAVEKASKDCQRAIKFCEKWKAVSKPESTDSKIERWSNAAYRILLRGAGPAKDNAERLYYNSKYNSRTRDPLLEVSQKLKLRVMIDNISQMQIISPYSGEEIELVDSISTALNTRPKPFPSQSVIVRVSWFALENDTILQTLKTAFNITITEEQNTTYPVGNKRRYEEGKRVLHLRYLEDIPRLFEWNLRVSSDSKLLAEICQDHRFMVLKRNFAFKHPALDPFYYYPPYANNSGTQLPIDTAFTLMATSGTARGGNSIGWYTEAAAKYISVVHETYMRRQRRTQSQEDNDNLTSNEYDLQVEMAFRIAVSVNNTQVVSKMIELYPACVTPSDNNKSLAYAVIRASYTGDVSILRSMLGRAQPSLHPVDSLQRNIFHYAAYYSIRSVEAMRCLLEYHKCTTCLLAKASFRGEEYTVYEMVSVARRKHRLHSDDEDFIDDLLNLLEKMAGTWVKTTPGN